MYIFSPVLSFISDSWSFLWSSSVCSSLSFFFFLSFAFLKSFRLSEFLCSLTTKSSDYFRLCMSLFIPVVLFASFAQISGLGIDWIRHTCILSAYIMYIQQLTLKMSQGKIKQRGWRVFKTWCSSNFHEQISWQLLVDFKRCWHYYPLYKPLNNEKNINFDTSTLAKHAWNTLSQYNL